MQVLKLNLFNFRNYVKTEINFSDGINVFSGENGSGKTNILEALYFIAYTKSFRTVNDMSLINYNNKNMLIEIEIKNNGIIKNISCELSLEQRKKIAKINNNRLSRLSKLIGEIPIVLFSPETIQIIKSDPLLRRNFVDEFLCLIENTYYDALLKYQKIISHRNFILKKIKEGKFSSNTLDIWNNQMINFGSEIIEKRVKLINEMNDIISSNFEIIKNKIKLTYNSKYFINYDITEIKNSYNLHLKNLYNEEIARGITLIGPHRDDIDIYFDDRLAKLYASEGQQRLIALILKFTQAKFLKLKNGIEPIILLDDFSSELDESNRGIIGKLLDNIEQVIITTTSKENIKNLKVKKSFYINNGTVNEII